MNDKFFFSLRYKITILFFGIGFLFSISLGFVAYKILEEELFKELRGHVGNITRMGSELLDKDAVLELIEQQKTATTPAQIDAVENSEAYRLISEQLNFMRDTERNLIRYVYLIAPTETPERAKYLADADVLNLKANPVEDAAISHFNSDMDVTPFPVLMQVFEDKTNIVEEYYTYDAAFKVNTVSGYAPVLSKDKESLVAVLGLDMADSQVQATLLKVLEKSIFIASLSLIVSFVTAIVMGTWVTSGIIKLDHLVRSFADQDFTARSDLKTNDEVGRLGFSFNHMAEMIQDYHARLEALVAAYGRFVPHDLLKMLEKKSILDVHLGDQIEREMAVLFSDIRGFTAISESMSPKDNFDYINSYLREVGPEIRSHHGIIDKYIGDAVMALFPDRIEDALNAALEMQRKVDHHNRNRSSHMPPIKIGIGIHIGKVMLGTIGEEQRMDGTVISDTVNLASRLESLTKRYGANIIVSDIVLDKLKVQKQYFFRLLDKVYVFGKNEPVTLYEVCNADDPETLRLKKSTFAYYSTAVDQYYAANFQEAEKSLNQVLKLYPGDIPARLLLDKVKSLLQNGVPAGWTGISRFDSKH